MGLVEHNAFQLVEFFLLLALVFRILLGAPLSFLFLSKWMGVSALSILGLGWASEQILLAYVVGVAVLCLVLIWHDLWPDNRRAGKSEFVCAAVAVFVYGRLAYDFLSTQSLPLFFNIWSALCTLFAVALLRQYGIEYGLRASKKLAFFSLLGTLASLAAFVLCWTSWGFETGVMSLLFAFVLLGYCARGNRP